MADEIGINDVAEAQRWANIHHRMLCSDIQHINELYERVAWLALPWWRRLGRKPPWFRARATDRREPRMTAEYERPVCRVTVVKGNHLTVRCGHPLPCPEHSGNPEQHAEYVAGSEGCVERHAPGLRAFYEPGADEAGEGSAGAFPGGVELAGDHPEADPAAGRSAGAEVGQGRGLLCGHDSIISNGHSEIVVRQGFSAPAEARTLVGQRGSTSGRGRLTHTGQRLSAAGSADSKASGGQSRRSGGAKENLEGVVRWLNV